MADQVNWQLSIEGMTCDHCARTIDDTLRSIPGVVESTTTYASKQASVVTEPEVDAATLAGAIRAKGFQVVSHQAKRPDQTRTPGDDSEFDLVVVGGGSAGFAAAIRAHDLGASVALVEGGTLGGTCVNVGCVPSKTLIRAAETYHRPARHPFAGIGFDPGRLDFSAVVEQKDALVAELQQAKYWDVLAAYPSIVLLCGRAKLLPDGGLTVDNKEVRARKILLTLGASPWPAPLPGLADVSHLNSTELMALKERPESLIVLGGGYVGLELGQVFARFGTKVTVLARSTLVSHEDHEISEQLAGYLREEGIDVHTKTTVTNVSGQPGSFRVEYEQDGERGFVEAEQILAATGRRPNTANVGLEEAGIKLGKRGEILVNEHLETSRPGVYAAGDVIGEPAFVYVAAYAGNLAAENALNGNTRNYDLSVVPRVTFTDPAVASVGLTETEARAKGIPVMVSKLPLSYVPRAIAARDTRGFIKLVANEETNQLVGAHILAPEAGDIIQQPALAIRFGIRVDEIASMLHPYLTNAEGIKLAAQTFKKDVAKLSCCAA